MARDLKPRNDNSVNSPDFDKLGEDAFKAIGERRAYLFKTQEEAIEFHKANYPVQTRKVLFEKYSIEILNRQHNKYTQEIFHKPRISDEETQRILEERRKRILKLTGVPELKKDRAGDFVRVTGYDPNEKKIENNSDWSSIYELF